MIASAVGFRRAGTPASRMEEDRMAQVNIGEGNDGVKHYEMATNGIRLHVTEQGEGPTVLFCPGFPDTPTRGAGRC